MAQDRDSRRRIRAAQTSPAARALHASKGKQAPEAQDQTRPAASVDLEREALLAATSEGVVVLAADGVLAKANHKARSMLGLADQDVGQSVRNVLARTLFAGSDGVPLPADSWPGLRALRGETVRNLDVGIHRDGRTTWLSTSAVPIVLTGGACGGAAVTLSDVTMLRTLEKHHEQMIRLMSHDIRNPLTAVHLNAQLLQKALTERGLEKEQRLASVVIAAARRLDAMIEELVDSSRVRSGQLRLELRPVAIEHMLPEILARNARTLDTTRVRLALPDGPVLITADIVRLERALVSVLRIALQNCADGAEVALRVALADEEVHFAVVVPGRAHASAEPPNPPSSQLDPIRADHGYGMGLFVARMLVERHGGRLWVESTPDRQATFHFALPVAGPEGESPRPVAA
ncbi:MAG TPA: PAS domain-containing sensor histidine kinase [Polyangia bacterium]|nr:PAS domain-containing sensor histidine kinase [Polyangia bacterium]